VSAATVPFAACTRTRWPGAIEPERAFAAKLPVPVALAYWTE
jgi:hypothetical protein